MIRTRKNRQHISAEEKQAIWADFELSDKPPAVPTIELSPQKQQQQDKPKERDQCDHCGDPVGISDEGFLICKNAKCSTVYTDVLNFAPEWRSTWGDDATPSTDTNRCSIQTDPLFEETSNNCKVAYVPGMSYAVKKVYKYVQWQTMTYKEKMQYDDFQYIQSMAQNGGISKKIIDDAFIYYKKIFDYQISFRGDNRSSIIAASIYIACRINGHPRTTKEIATLFNIDLGTATKGYKNAQAIITLVEQGVESIDKTQYCMSRPSLFVERFCNKLDMPDKLALLSEFICLKIEHFNLFYENTPQAIATGVIYLVASEFKFNLTKKRIKQVIDISEVTVNKCYKKLAINRHHFIPSGFTYSL